MPSRELVPGDIVELTVGDKVPADIRVVKLKTATLRTEQSSLTGESVAVLKCIEPVQDEECELQMKESMVFSGTAITNGACTGVVTTTGMSTEIGKIQAQIQQAAEEEGDTPLKQKLDAFGELLAKVRFFMVLLVKGRNKYSLALYTYFAKHYDLKMACIGLQSCIWRESGTMVPVFYNIQSMLCLNQSSQCCKTFVFKEQSVFPVEIYK